MTYYTDDRITYDKAEELVEEFVTDRTEARSLVTAKDVLRDHGIENSEHNRRRVHHALSQRFEVSEEWSSAQNKYEVDR